MSRVPGSLGSFVTDLVLPVQRRFFTEIRAGLKPEEFRLRNEYWERRIEGRVFSNVVITLGYPRREDIARRITRPWRGYRVTTIEHSLFGPDPVEVYAIWVADAELLGGPLCRCLRCLRERDARDPDTDCPTTWSQMVVCRVCGNKRCPHATDHRNACTRSNAPGQVGSVYQ